jgi:hypothetical protein
LCLPIAALSWSFLLSSDGCARLFIARRARHDGLIEQALNKADTELFATGKRIEGRDNPLLRIRRNPHALGTVGCIAQQCPGKSGDPQRLEN